MKETVCPNCDYQLNESYSFCPNCGQETDLDDTIKGLLSHFLSDYFTFDSKIARSIIPLVTRPAFLTKEYLEGKRVQYIPPLRLFIFLSIIFFLLLSLLKTSDSTITQIDGLNEAFWDRYFDSWLPKLFFILLPIFALLINWLYRRKKRGLMQHFLFSLHFHSTLFLVGIIYSIISFLFISLNLSLINEVFFAAVTLYLAIYLWKSLRKMYGETRKRTIWKFLVLAISYSFSLVVLSLVLLALSLNY